MQKYLKIRWVYHSLMWILAFLVFLLNGLRMEEDKGFWGVSEDFLIYFVPAIPIVYLNLYLKAKLFDQRKYLMYFVLFPLLVFSGGGLLQLVYRIFQVKGELSQDFINIFSLSVLSVGAQYFKRGIVNQFRLQELKAKNVEAELQMLKAQLNPHFMFNTLNNIYAINEADAGKGSAMILGLSDVMRYHIESIKLSFITLSEEVKLIKSYIDLEKLRLSSVTRLEMRMGPLNSKLKISPLLLLPFVENAFKYGTHPLKASTISMQLISKENSVFFEIENMIIPGMNVLKTHIGLENTRRRLELIYPDKHRLDILHEVERYKVSLRIDVG